MCRLWILIAMVACSKSNSAETTGSAATAAPVDADAARQATDERIAREAKAAAAARTAYVKLTKDLAGVSAAIESKPRPCKKRQAPDARTGKSIGLDLLKTLATGSHNPLASGDGLASESLVAAIKIPFLESQRRMQDYDPVKAEVALGALQGQLFPLAVIRVEDFVAPTVAGAKTYRPGRANGTAYVVEAATAVPCTVRVAAASAKTVNVLELEGMASSPEMVNARLANDLMQNIQGATSAQLAKLGLAAGLEPVSAKR